MDKAAATRFIKHAIAQAQQPATENQEEARISDEAGPSQPSKIVPTRVTDKMREREQYLAELKEQDENEEEEPTLEVFNDENSELAQTQQNRETEAKGSATSVVANSKKRRKAMDPFACM